jgi:hypothetical protein
LNLLPFTKNGDDVEIQSSISKSKEDYQNANFQLNTLIVLSHASVDGNPVSSFDLSEKLEQSRKRESELAVVFHKFSPAFHRVEGFVSLPPTLSLSPTAEKFLKDNYQSIRDSVFWEKEDPSISSPKILKLALDLHKSEQKKKIKFPFRARFQTSGERRFVVFITEDCQYSVGDLFETSFSKPLLDLARILAGEIFPVA